MRSPSRAWVLLSAAGVALFQVAGSFGAAEGQPERKGIDLLAVALLLSGPAALAVRDRHPRVAVSVPILATLLFIGSGYPFGPVFLSVVVGLFTAIGVGERRAAWLAAGAGYVGFWLAIAVDERADDIGLLHFSLVAGWLLAVLTLSELARGFRERAAERARAAEEDRLRREGEQRLGLAQELHDVLAHNISLINVQASVALHLLDEQPEQARPALSAIKGASHEALQELRSALDLLRSGADGAPLAPAPRLGELGTLVDGVRASGLAVELEVGALPPLPVAVEVAAYRIVQEALTNVTRHARATRAVVRVGAGDAVSVEVLDDGVGGAAEPGNGIRGMRERATALGGELEAGPRAEGGFAVRARLPVAVAAP